uniref:Cadherin domain-containing protein n=1 Tax=Magallana gigas TaxID=29159 RepID=A0A8W8LG70_MAGGI
MEKSLLITDINGLDWRILRARRKVISTLDAVPIRSELFMDRRQRSSSYKILEEQMPSTFVGNIANDSNIRNEVTPVMLKQLKFQIWNAPAHDGDSESQNSALTYQLLSGGNTFSVRTVPDVDSRENLEIVVEKKLDREVQDFYQLVIVAKDSGSPQRNGTLHVKDTFLLNETTGEIKISSPLDYEQETKYQFVVIARDNGRTSLSTQVIVNITVLDINDNAPQININLPPGGTGVVENAEIGQYIATVVVTDSDGGENGTVNCTISNENFNIVKMFSNIFKITLGSRLDRERVPEHNVTINCFDFGKPPKTNKTFFYVKVSDVNDNVPVFSQNIYEADFPENNNIGDMVVHVTATDKDEGENGQVTYKFKNLQPYFAINPTSGIISANNIFR